MNLKFRIWLVAGVGLGVLLGLLPLEGSGAKAPLLVSKSPETGGVVRGAKENAVARPGVTTEDIAEVIRKAQNLLLQRDRLQAMTILGNAQKRAQRKTEKMELATQIEKAGDIFFSDQGLQTYEFANSIRSSQPVQAEAKYREALAIEGPNTRVLVHLVRLLIHQGDYKGGLRQVAKAQEVNASSLTLKLLEIQALAALEDLGLLEAALNSEQGKSLPPGVRELYVYEFDAKRRKTEGLLLPSPKVAPGGAMAQVWRVQTYMVPIQESTVSAVDKYLEFCRGHEKTILDDLALDPRLCSDYDKVHKMRASYEATRERAPNEPKGPL